MSDGNERLAVNSVDIYSRTDLTPRDVKAIEREGKFFASNGQTGDVVEVTEAVGLTDAQVEKLSLENGRKVSNRVLLKSSWPTSGNEFPPSELVKRDAEMRKNPRIAPFAVLASAPYVENYGKPPIVGNPTYFFMEYADGLNPDLLDLPPDTFEQEDTSRILFQLSQIAQTYTDQRFSSGDTLKDLRYLKDEKPPRVLLFDLAYRYMDSLEDVVVQNDPRLKANDRKVFSVNDDMKDLADHFKRTMKRSDLSHLQPILEKMGKGEYRSFAEISSQLNELSGNKFAEEYKEIAKLEPILQ